MTKPLITTLLVPLDFAAPSSAALAQANKLAQKCGAEVVLQYVVEPVRLPAEWTLAILTRYIDVEPKLVKHANESLRELAQTHFANGVAVRYRVDKGPAREMILAAATEENADLIVIASHHKSRLGHLVQGSTAEHVVRAAHCPVLKVQYDEE